MKTQTKDFTLRWISEKPMENNRVALLVPAYNELSNSKFFERLNYLKTLAEETKEKLDIIIVYDGSSDNSLHELEKFTSNYKCSFYVCRVWPNGNKVGAQKMVIQDVSHEYIIMSDFDTDIDGIECLENTIDELDANPETMGYFFKLLPFDGRCLMFSFQLLEYGINRGFYKLYKDGCVPVMPGAGSLFRKSALHEIFDSHSGLRNGEDRESTVIGLTKGYKTFYQKNILAFTRTPPNFTCLVKQRVRWYLGYLETVFKEKKYYTSSSEDATMQIKTIIDLFTLLICTLLPYLIVGIAWINPTAAWISILSLYITSIGLNVGIYLIAKEELKEIKDKLGTIMLYSIIEWALEYVVCTKAIYVFFKSKNLGFYDFSNNSPSATFSA